MPICSYVVVPMPGTAQSTQAALSEIQGCQVVPAENRDVLLLVTETDSSEEDRVLRNRLYDVPGIQALLMTFGEVQAQITREDPGPEGCP